MGAKATSRKKATAKAERKKAKPAPNERTPKGSRVKTGPETIADEERRRRPFEA
jgi:hypothetical protein